ncbi:ROK family transcriptional regulator [Devosia limi DSM 17137]|uniref:ROK family transcriptional regulator n=1 Tax=Devosia limi DSM 17137 TaxID=1121477 RepID=A0A0F5L3P8_9HYPH|nr:ROK family protein [Devosia limi]KKB76845.1 ROK family transcriptional regulator [Devosia limi DSM 17137]SHF27444.1 Sugar kinase of the NBD/HSP70 family, may contain an N-terminal HTH domain [Devosia limi DSM 17137]
MTSQDKRGMRQRVAIGSNPERNRAHNRRVVLEVIRLHGHLGRTDIARRAQLTPQAVANIVEELLDDGLLIELGRLRSGRGQPPIQFAVNPDGPLTVGVEIAADHMVTVLLDLSGGLRAQAISRLERTDPDFIPGHVASEVEKLQTMVGATPTRLLGIGVVMPGPFEIEGMSSVGPATLPGWTGVDAATLIAKATGEHVVLENDATAAAVGERLYGAGRQLGNFCYLYFGVGLGLGVIQEGRPLRGAFGNAGEIGHIGLVPRRGKAIHGPEGALERFASVYALRDHLAAAGIAATSVEDIQALHDANNPHLAAWIAVAADYLAPTVAMIENIFDPEAVVFGGGLPDSVLDAVISALYPLPMSVATRSARASERVLRGQTGQLTAALGAAALPLLETVSPHLSVGPASAGPAG